MLGVFEPVGHVEFLQRALDAQLVFRHLAAGARLFQFVFWGLWQEKKNKQTKEERRSDALFDGRGTPRPMVFLSFFFRSWADDSNGIGRLTEFWRDFKDIELVGLVIDYYRYRYIFSELVPGLFGFQSDLPGFTEFWRDFKDVELVELG